MSNVAVEAARQMLAELSSREITVRALGGVAIGIRCETTTAPSPLARDYGDLDLATTYASSTRLAKALKELGYEPATRFNALHGRRRLLFHAPDDGHVDVFVDRFVMCHVLDLRERLEVDAETLSLADLLLTKLQIAAINRKDVVDIVALLLDHQLTENEGGINVAYVTHLAGHEWGWWRTITLSLEVVRRVVGDLGLEGRLESRVREAIAVLIQRLTNEKKSPGWRMRALVGERFPWRDDPEETG